MPLVLVEWLGIAVEARRLPHSGWLYGRGWTEIREYTTGWALGSGHIVHALAGYGFALLLAPFSWFAGPALPSALPAIVLLQVLVLVPLGALGVYVLGARSGGGRLAGYLAAAAWTLGPFVASWYFELESGWHNRLLPQLLWLTARPELPSALALVVAAVLVLRGLDEHRVVDAVAAGAFVGLAIGMLPENVLFLAAPVLVLLASRRWRELAAFAGGLVPAVVTYVLWTESALGHATLPLPHHAFSWHEFRINWQVLVYGAWSPRVLHWLAIAGFIGLLKRAPVKALFFGAWVGAYALGEGASDTLRAFNLPFFELWLPALPAFCVLIASLPLLWPHADVKLPRRFPYLPTRRVPAAVPALVAALVPLVWVAVASPWHSHDAVVHVQRASLLVPERGPAATAVAHGKRVTINWEPLTVAHVQTAYAVYRSPAGGDVRCNDHGAADCVLNMRRVTVTHRTSLSQTRRPGTFAYRIAVVAARGPKKIEPLLLIGPRTTVRVR